jgi:hypothetical protein
MFGCGGAAAFDEIAAGPCCRYLASSSSPPGRSKVVDGCEIGQFRTTSGDHYEGQFEGQNGARECLREPVSACVS